MQGNQRVATILVVEDDPSLSQVLAGTLRVAGYEVHCALSGAKAMEYAKSQSIRAAIIDIHLPDAHGLILSQQLRATCGPDTPLLILSGDSSMSVINSLPFAGATYFFRKPVESKLLLERLADLLTVDRLTTTETNV